MPHVVQSGQLTEHLIALDHGQDHYKATPSVRSRAHHDQMSASWGWSGGGEGGHEGMNQGELAIETCWSR